MAITVDKQRKYKFSAEINTPTRSYTELNVDVFTPAEKRFDPIKRNNQELGQIHIRGPVSLGEASIKIAMMISAGDAPNQNAQLIKDLESLEDSDADTFRFAITMENKIQGLGEGSYNLVYDYCRLISIKMDDLDSHADDAIVQWTIAFQPGKISRQRGTQIG